MLYHKDQQLIKDENSAFQLAALSVIGDRDDQQDSFGYRLKQEEGLIVICDGMGGSEGGKAASELAVEMFLADYAESSFNTKPSDMLIETAKKADAMVFLLKNEEGKLLKAGTTLASVIINRRKLTWCSVGDSRAYLLRNGELAQITQDHNYHTVLVGKKNEGLLDETEFQMESARGEALISFLGIGNLGLIDYSEVPLELQKDDRIIIMSDGLYKVVTDPEIARILDNFTNIGEAVQALEIKAKKNAANNNILRDNMTVALIKIK
ncbi:MAG: serine/threonine-protein phosphatase [Clostridia bacterium]|nr:serine/threonine-protein phosphatase [Clostridia bacterium]